MSKLQEILDNLKTEADAAGYLYSEDLITKYRTNVPRLAKALLRVENMTQESRKRFAEGCKIVELMTIIDEGAIDILAILKGERQ